MSEPCSNTERCRSATAASKIGRNAGEPTATFTARSTNGSNRDGMCSEDTAWSATRAAISDRTLGWASSEVARALNWSVSDSTWPA